MQISATNKPLLLHRCESCGSNSLSNINGLHKCDYCGCKYGVELTDNEVLTDEELGYYIKLTCPKPQTTMDVLTISDVPPPPPGRKLKY